MVPVHLKPVISPPSEADLAWSGRCAIFFNISGVYVSVFVSLGARGEAKIILNPVTLSTARENQLG